MKKQNYVPRGIRNNNPTNIRIGNQWLGERKNPTDPDFEQFDSMVYGCRAAFIILRRYINRYHRDCVTKIISSWAPETENKTKAYIDCVCSQMNVQPDQLLSFEDRAQMVALVDAMIRVECGQPVSESTLIMAYNIAVGHQ